MEGLPGPRHCFIIGAQRCGTSYLYRLLDDHPAIEMARPLRPEPKTFLGGGGPASAAEYRVRFSDDRAPVKGEKSTSYLDDPAGLARIAALFDPLRLLVAVRDPVQRALSHYRFTRAAGLEPLPADEALGDPALADRDYDRTRISVSPYAYLPRGRYADALARVDALVGTGHVHVVVFEELLAGREALQAVYRFLDVDPDHRPSGAGQPVNASPPDGVTLSEATRARLRAYYADANAALERRLGRTLPWPR